MKARMISTRKSFTGIVKKFHKSFFRTIIYYYISNMKLVTLDFEVLFVIY